MAITRFAGRPVESGSAPPTPPTPGTPTTYVRTYTVGLGLGDVAYQKADGTADQADASALATSKPMGVVSAIDSPAVGQCEIVHSGDVAVTGPLTPGAVYILGSSPGVLVDITDTVNPNYPAYATPGSGESLVIVGVAQAAGSLAVNLQGISATG